MQELVVSLLKEVNTFQLIIIGMMIWYSHNSLEKDLNKLDEKLQKMNTRVSRVEGTVYGRQIYENVEEKLD